MLTDVTFLDRILDAAAAPFAPLARGLAREVVSSPWSNTDNLTQIAIEDLWGFVAPRTVNRTEALRISTVARARNVLATTVGRLPLYTEKGGAKTATQSSLLAQPEKNVPLSTTLTWTIDALFFYPCTWWHVTERDAAGWPMFVEWVDRGRAELDADGKLTKIDGKPVAPADVIRFDSPLGTGLLDIARTTLTRSIAINRSAANAEENPVPSIDLHHTDKSSVLGREERELLVQQWRDARIKGGIGYTPASIEAKAMGLVPEQLLIEGRKAIKVDLAQHTNVPAWVLDVELNGSSITYQNRQSRNAEVIDQACSPYMSAITDRLSLGDVTPRGWRVKFDTDDLTKPDMQTRFTTYKTGIDGGFVTADQVAAWEGWNQNGAPA